MKKVLLPFLLMLICIAVSAQSQTYNVTLASVMNGTISASQTSCVAGAEVTLTATPSTGSIFDSWIVYKSDNVNTTVSVTNNKFTMPAYDVTVAAVFSAPQVTNVTIGNGTSSTKGKYLPTRAFSKYSLTQQIYTSTEVDGAGAITKVAFKVNKGESATRNIDIYLSHTNKSVFYNTTDWVNQNASNRVFSGSVAFSDTDWTIITLTTPFEYNGTNPLILTVHDNTGTFCSIDENDAPAFYTYKINENRALYYYVEDAEGTNINPASMSTTGFLSNYYNQVIFTKETAGSSASISVSTASLTGFSTIVESGASDSKSLSIIGVNLQNNVVVTPPTGYEICATASGTYANSLSFTPSNGNVSQMVYVRLKAGLSVGDYNGTMTITSGTTTRNVSLSGEVVSEPVVQYTITVNANPVEGGVVTGAGQYDENSICTLHATANTGYSFDGWQLGGNTVSTNPEYSFEVTDNATYTAVFTAKPIHNITVCSVQHGTIGANKTTATEGETITLTSNPDTYYFVYGWLVYKTGDVNTTVTVTNNTFEMPDYDVTVFAIIKHVYNHVVIGEGTDKTYGYVLPTHVMYNYSLTQQIYTSAEVGAAGTIVAFQIFYAGDQSGAASATGERSFNIYMKHIGSSTLSSWVQVASSDLVFSGTMSFEATGWYTCTLDTPFEYNGTSNLLLTVDDNTGSSVAARRYFYDYNTNANRSLYTCSDYTNYNPETNMSGYDATTCIYNTQIIFQETVDVPEIAALPNPLEGFVYKQGSGPSMPLSFALVGEDLDADITVTAPANYEICATEDGAYVNSLTITRSELVTANIYVKLKAGLGVGVYNEALILTSSGVEYEVALHGAVTDNTGVVPTYGPDFPWAISSDYSGNGMALTAQVKLAGQNVDKTTLGVGAFCGNECRGNITPLTDWTDQGLGYFIDMNIVGNDGDNIVFYLYDAATERVCGVSEMTLDVDNDTYQGQDAMNNRGRVVLNFMPAPVIQNISLARGWNWFTPTIGTTLANLEEQLESNGIIINSQSSGFIQYTNGTWTGTLEEIVPGNMYQIQTSAACDVILSGFLPSSVSITVVKGYNWFGYAGAEDTSIQQVLNGFTPVEGDMINSYNEGFTQYVNGVWTGTLEQLKPGHGYIYMSNDTNAKQLNLK